VSPAVGVRSSSFAGATGAAEAAVEVKHAEAAKAATASSFLSFILRAPWWRVILRNNTLNVSTFPTALHQLLAGVRSTGGGGEEGLAQHVELHVGVNPNGLRASLAKRIIAAAATAERDPWYEIDSDGRHQRFDPPQLEI
jgi:hypothetical protein